MKCSTWNIAHVKACRQEKVQRSPEGGNEGQCKTIKVTSGSDINRFTFKNYKMPKLLSSGQERLPTEHVEGRGNNPGNSNHVTCRSIYGQKTDIHLQEEKKKTAELLQQILTFCIFLLFLPKSLRDNCLVRIITRALPNRSSSIEGQEEHQ